MGLYVDELTIPVTPIDNQNVTPSTAGYVGGENIILERANATKDIVTDQTTRVNDYLTQAEALLTGLAMPAGWTSAAGNVVINPVSPIDESSVPPPSGSLTLPGFTGITFNPVPAAPAFPTINTDYIDPTEPAEVNPTIDYMMSTYTSAMWLSLFNKVSDGITNGGTGLDANVEAALHARDSERKRLANEKAYNTALTNVSSRALSFPQLAMANLDARMAAEILRQEHASSNEIVIASGDLAQKNTHFMIDKGVALETMLRDFWKAQESMSLEAKKAIAEFILKTYAEKNQAYLGKYQAIIAKIRAKVEAANAVVAHYTAISTAYKAETDGKIAQVEAIAKERTSIVELAGHDVEVFKARVAGQTAFYNAQAENQKAQIQKSELEVRKAEAELKAILDSFVSINSLREKILDNLGGTSAQVMASALNALSINIGASVTSSKSVQESYDHNHSISVTHHQSLGEDHNISHKGDDV